MNRDTDGFSPQLLLGFMAGLPACKRLIVGFSGGADSTALLLALHQLAGKLEHHIEAVHFNHGLQSAANDWQEFCQSFCQQRKIPLQVFKLDLPINPGTSPETLAREARYKVIRQLVTKDDIYLTAHHADDQAETILLNLLRGSGATGLAGIPQLRRISQGWMAKPLLDIRRAAMEAWLQSQEVQWICDASNLDHAMDRNFLRGHIIPQLEQRWPGAVTRLNQSAKHMQQRSVAFVELLSQFPGYLSTDGFTLDLRDFSRTTRILQAEIIRNWAQQRGAPAPPRARLQEFLEQLHKIKAGSHAELNWRGWLIRHHRARLWMHEIPLPPPCPEVTWRDVSQLDLGATIGRITLTGNVEEILHSASVCGRQSLVSGHNVTQSEIKLVKEIMRITGVPDWLRNSIPLLISGGRLSAIGDWWFSPGFKAQLKSKNQRYTWRVEDPLLRQVQSVCHHWAVDPDGSLV